MKKLASFILLLSLAGCSSGEITEMSNQLDELKQTNHHLKSQTAKLMFQLKSLQYVQATPESDRYERARLKTQIKIMDESLSSEIRVLEKKIFETKQLLEFQIIRIESLEDARPTVEPMDSKKPSFRK